MKIIVIVYLFLIVNYSYGRFTSDWSINNDQSMIEECLRKSLKHIEFDQDIRMALKQTTNIVCLTQINNGINIKLTFNFREQRWECLLYKSLIESLSIQYEKCRQIDQDNTPIEASKTNNDDEEEEDDEAKIDKMNQNNRSEKDEEEPEENKNSNQNNLDLGGPDQNVNPGRQSNIGLDDREQVVENTDNQNEDEKEHSNVKQLNLDSYDRVEIDEDSNEEFGKNRKEAPDDNDNTVNEQE